MLTTVVVLPSPGCPLVTSTVFGGLPAVDSNIVYVDTGAFIQLGLVRPDTLGAATTVEVYDVDMDGAEDADPTVVTSAFTPLVFGC